MSVILGINAYHGDVSAALVCDGRIVAAVEEERFRRVKHWAGFPEEAIRACLTMGGVAPGDIDRFAISRNPRAHLWRKVLFALRHRPKVALVADRRRNQRRIHELPARIAVALDLDTAHVRARTRWIEHHPSHVASAFFVSPFDEAAVCAIDGFGDFVSTSAAMGRGSHLESIANVYFPHSLGLLYLAITQYLGFPRYGDEFKVMGLAPYGSPDFANEIQQLIHFGPGFDFQLDLGYFQHHTGAVSMTSDDGEPVIDRVFTPRLEKLLGPARSPDEPLTPRHEAIAASVQVVFEEAALHLLNALHETTRMARLCLAGGCAMNSVMNGKIRERTPFEETYIQPAAGDNGTALGAALYVAHQEQGEPRRFVMEHGYWGPAFSDADIRAELGARSPELADCRTTTFDDAAALCRWTATKIAEGQIVGWFQGRMEWGARALGNRSILADPRRPDMRDIINSKIKRREKFRPFAPSILEEALDDYFEGAVPDPFMMQVYPVRTEKRSVIPAVTHVDGSGRLQTVSRAGNPIYWQLIDAFRQLTGVPVLLNTSFNENEPIVHRPSEAVDCFLRTDMDVLVLGSIAVEKVRMNLQLSEGLIPKSALV